MTTPIQGPMTLSALRRHRQTIADLARRRGVISVKVFGSVARGEARPDSDVDLLVELEPGRSLLDLGGFREDVSELLRRPVHVLTPRTLRGELDTKTLGEALAL